MLKTNQFYLPFLTLLFMGTPHAQTADDGWVIENIHGPSQVGIVDTIPVDINHDGLMDVVSASIEDGHLRAYINQGNLKFEQQYISTDVLGAYRVSATDFNNDGEIDFLIPSIETNEIIALIADNTVQPYGYRKQIIAEGVLLPTDAQAGDFNNDGLIDVVSISFEENLVLLHLQNNQGEFTTSLLSSSPQRPRKSITADINNDGLMDILVASSEDNSIRLFENQGGGSFTEQIVSDQMTGARFLASCDINHDALIDLVVSASEKNSIYMFVNMGEGGFSFKAIDQDARGVNALHCSNIDSDSETELIAIASTVGNIYSYELSGELNKQLVANTRDGYLTVSVADLNNAGDIHIITQAYFENRNLIYSTSQVNQEQVLWEDFPDGVNSIKYADLNADGVDDIVVANFRGDSVNWYDGITYQKHTVSDDIDGASEIFITDLDDDGMIDILTAASYASKAFWHRNMGEAVFETMTVSDKVSFANGIIAADVNGDNKLDVIVTSGTDDTVRWFDRTEFGFIEYLVDSSNDAPNDVKGSDIDNDGDIDLIVPYFFSDEISMYLNNGEGVFDEIILDKYLDAAYEVVSAYINDDNYIDFIATGSRAGVVKEYLSIDKNLYEESDLISLVNPREVRIDQSGDIWISSPGEANVTLLQKPFSNLRVFQIIEEIEGVSDIDISTNKPDLITSLFDSDHIFKVKKDIIFLTGFEKILNKRQTTVANNRSYID